MKAGDIVPLELRFELLTGPEPPVVLNLGPVVTQSCNGSFQVKDQKYILQTRGIGESTKACQLIPHFRLLGACINSQNEGDLVEIDALLV